jgi:dsDNA-specific endonuclease/ATPase MutS2
MINIKDLWIGEAVKLKASGKSGKFLGINTDGKARIQTEGKIILTASHNLEIIPEKEFQLDIDEFLKLEQEKNRTSTTPLKIKFDHTLDLHIEKLAPHMENELAARILEFQLLQSENFIKNAIEKKYHHFTIIHGKGQGVLKQAIEHQLSLFHQVKITFSKNGGGAVEVWL